MNAALDLDPCKHCGKPAMWQRQGTGRKAQERAQCTNYDNCGIQTPWAAVQQRARTREKWNRKA